MNRHAFTQDEIVGDVEHAASARDWDLFNRTAKMLGFKIAVTGGAYLTHEIACSQEDYEITKQLAKEQ